MSGGWWVRQQVFMNIVLDEAFEEKDGGEKVGIGMVVSTDPVGIPHWWYWFSRRLFEVTRLLCLRFVPFSFALVRVRLKKPSDWCDYRLWNGSARNKQLLAVGDEKDLSLYDGVWVGYFTLMEQWSIEVVLLLVVLPKYQRHFQQEW